MCKGHLKVCFFKTRYRDRIEMFRNISWQEVFDYDAIIISKFRTFLERLEGLIFFKKRLSFTRSEPVIKT